MPGSWNSRSQLALLALVAVGALLSACAAAPGEPQEKPSPGIVYVEMTQGEIDPRIVTRRLDGTGTKVVFRSSVDESLHWMVPSPDAQTLLLRVYARSPAGHDGWRTMPFAGGGWLPFPAPAGVEFPVWSPSGDALAWNLNGSIGITKAGVDSFFMLTTFGVEGPTAGIWSPDGAQVVVSRYAENAENGADLYLVNRTGGITPLVVGEGDDNAPDWSPATGMIAFVRGHSYSYSAERGLYVVTADGSAVRRVASGDFGGSAYWSHDGSMIATYLSDPPHGYVPVVVTVATGRATRLKPATSHYPSRRNPWSFDDSQLLTLAAIDGIVSGGEALFVADLHGNYRQLTADSVMVTDAVWVP